MRIHCETPLCFPYQVLFENFLISAQNVLVIFYFLKLWFESVYVILNLCGNLYQNAWLKILLLINFLYIMQMFDLQLSPTPKVFKNLDNIKVTLKSIPLFSLLHRYLGRSFIRSSRKKIKWMKFNRSKHLNSSIQPLSRKRSKWMKNRTKLRCLPGCARIR